jgi:hypothetical protein
MLPGRIAVRLQDGGTPWLTRTRLMRPKNVQTVPLAPGTSPQAGDGVVVGSVRPASHISKLTSEPEHAASFVPWYCRHYASISEDEDGGIG